MLGIQQRGDAFKVPVITELDFWKTYTQLSKPVVCLSGELCAMEKNKEEYWGWEGMCACVFAHVSMRVCVYVGGEGKAH